MFNLLISNCYDLLDAKLSMDLSCLVLPATVYIHHLFVLYRLICSLAIVTDTGNPCAAPNEIDGMPKLLKHFTHSSNFWSSTTKQVQNPAIL